MPVVMEIVIEQETEHGVRLVVNVPGGQACTAREKLAHDELQKNLAEFALKIHARSAESEQGGN